MKSKLYRLTKSNFFRLDNFSHFLQKIVIVSEEKI